MKLLLTSSGVANDAIKSTLIDLLGKPIEESDALVVPTGILPFPGGAQGAARLIRGETPNPLTGLGWRSLGLLELTALPSIDPDVWTTTVREADALLVWGGDPVFLAHWMRESGLGQVLRNGEGPGVYVGVSAGSMVTATTFAETFPHPSTTAAHAVTYEPIAMTGPEGDFEMTLATCNGIGLTDIAVIPHYRHADHPEASEANAVTWASRIPSPSYAIDDASAVVVVDGEERVVSEGSWQHFAQPR